MRRKGFFARTGLFRHSEADAMEKKKSLKNSLVPVVSQPGIALLIPLLYQLLGSAHLCNNKADSELRVEQRADMEEDEEVEREIDWAAGLPPEMICSISRWLPVPDYIKIRAVCSSWASALAGGLHLPAAQHVPWLGLKCGGSESKPSFLATESSENRRYNLSPIPSVYEGEWIGARDGWLVISHLHSKYVWLLNPITGARLDLPSLHTLPVEQSTIRKVVLSPVSSGDAVAFALYGRQTRLAFARPKDKEWTALPIHSADDEIVDAVHHGGKFVCLTSRGHLHAYDLNGPSPCAEHISTSDSSGGCANPLDNVYLVSTPAGDLLKVLEKKVCSDAKIITRGYSSIMKFNATESCWAKIEDLEDLSFFLDLYQSVALSARDVRGLRGNCIYFAAPEFYAESESNGYYVNDVGVFDVKKGVGEPYIPDEFRTIGRWHRLPPIWFMPSLS